MELVFVIYLEELGLANMINRPLLTTLEKLVEIDRTLSAEHQNASLYLKRAEFLALLGCNALAMCDNRIASLIEKKETLEFYNEKTVFKDLTDTFPQLYFSEQDTVYYNYLYEIVFNDKFLHQEKLDPMHYIARAGNLKKLGLFQLALRDYKQGIESLVSFPQEHAIACMDTGMLLNLLGDYEFGWKFYEKRWETRYKAFEISANFPRPRWTGELISGTLLIHSEQGIGDNIQFVRYAIYLKQLGMDVLVWNNEYIDDFLSYNLAKYGIATAKGGDEVQFSHWIEMMSLPTILETRLDNIPYTAGYLSAKSSYVQKWQEKLPLAKRRIGIVWRGGSATDTDKIRSISLDIFSHLFSLDADFHCLQKDINTDEQAILAQYANVYDWHNEIESFFDTSAIVEQMDLVICVDTSVAHLSAAMGKPTWILINYSPDFRWLLNRENSVWYDSVKLFRQGLDYDWSNVINQINDQWNHPNKSV